MKTIKIYSTNNRTGTEFNQNNLTDDQANRTDYKYAIALIEMFPASKHITVASEHGYFEVYVKEN